ncbi:CLUMA_CG012787, isoform A [Clunio marinus]|uniref:CLUMA_CG012787, isoform A n=1 Tax=Clunio marinus TaxID=568069 RepID=A0A1J1IJK7_9DIPT|nr:CLUMA_CG012787, isoform A [Clunio marinus]
MNLFNCFHLTLISRKGTAELLNYRMTSIRFSKLSKASPFFFFFLVGELITSMKLKWWAENLHENDEAPSDDLSPLA